MLKDEVIDFLRRREPALRDMGVVRLALFGSVARGEERPASDIDVMIEVSPDARFSLLDRIGIQHDIEDAFGRHAQVCEPQELPQAVAVRVARDSVTIFG
ncbi:MAG: nucleotidyltransferase domain-containing protein [Alphaproteobacteria bacterium]|nr:nucleotidyltransferase domain-containing protein [Alphaproteobacteria bacterium]MCW5742859.1 nucleotidyltransferase domain-containing protein [Alphaproteobacteria bacterium]